MGRSASVSEEQVEAIVGFLADGLSQARIAASIGVTSSSLSRFLTRRPEVRRRTQERRKARIRAARSRERRAQQQARALVEGTRLEASKRSERVGAAAPPPGLVLAARSRVKPLRPAGRSRGEDQWLGDRERLVTFHSPDGKRVLRVDPSSEEYRECVEDGWRAAS